MLPFASFYYYLFHICVSSFLLLHLFLNDFTNRRLCVVYVYFFFFVCLHQRVDNNKKVVRRNASDKMRLIKMVHDHPILWDSRLPNFKGAEEDKNSAWDKIGKEFKSTGRRVARAFKSLRESYRRELAYAKVVGAGFKSKWSLYESMDFLRDVIRERKYVPFFA